AAPRSGVLSRIEKQEGETVGLNEVLGTIEEGASAGAAAGEGDAVEAKPDAAVNAARGAAVRAEAGGGAAAPGTEERAATATPPQSSPAARAIAAEHGIDIASISGTGPNGRVTKEDVLQALERRQAEATPAAPPEPPPSAPPPPAEPAPARPSAPPPTPTLSADGKRETRERMSRRRQTI